MKSLGFILIISFTLSIFSRIDTGMPKIYDTSYMNLFFVGGPRLQMTKSNKGSLKELEKENERKMHQMQEQQRVEDIYRKYLASRIKSSLISDFLTSRY
jgi:hypothetical protein